MLQAKKGREHWIDGLKTIGMFYIVLGHLAINTDLKNYIYSFHVPLFFFVSGYLFNSVKYNRFWDFFKNRFLRIMVPYFFFSFATYLFWLVFVCRFFEGPEIKNNTLKPLVGIFYSNGIDNWLRHNTPIWFLTCLFLVEIAFFVLNKYIKNKTTLSVVVILFSAGGYILSLTDFFRLPWGINMIPLALLFYHVGFVFKEQIGAFFRKVTPVYLLLVPVLIIVNMFLVRLNGRVDINYGVYGNYFIFYITAFAGIFCYAVLGKFVGINKVLSFVGQNSLAIMCLHSPIAFIIKYVQYFIFGIPLNYGEGSTLFAVSFAILQILLIVPLVFLMKKYIPVLTGYKKASKQAVIAVE